MLRFSVLTLALFLFSILPQKKAGCQTIKIKSEITYTALSKATDQNKVKFLNQLVDYRLFDSIDRAIDLSNQAIQLAQAANSKKDLSNSLVSLGKSLFIKNQLEQSTDCFYKSLQLKQKISDISGIETNYFFLGRIRQKEGKIEHAISKFRIALKYTIINKNYPIEGRCYTEMANCCKQLNMTFEMAAYLNKAYITLLKGGDSTLLAGAFLQLGLAFRDLGKTEKSAKAQLQAVRIAENLGDSLTLGYGYSNLSDLFAWLASDDKALEYNQKALQIFTNIHNKRGMAYSMNFLAQIYADRKEYPTALKYYLEAGKLKREVEDWQGACFIYNNIADLYIQKTNFSLARQYLTIAEILYKKADDRLSEVVVLKTYGLLYSAQKEHVKARSSFEKSLAIAEQLKLHDFITSNLSAISAEYQAEGKPAEALAYYKRFTASRDSVAMTEDRKTLAELKVKYETEKKETQLKELSGKQLNGSPKNRTWLYGNIVVGVFLILSAMLLGFWVNKKVRLAQKTHFVIETGMKFHNTLKTINRIDHASKPILTPDQQKSIWIELNRIMENEKLYLKSTLKLSELAGRLNTNTSYLSKVINDESQENFCNYLNQLRIREARILLSDPENQHITIEGIAQTVGFNSKSAFNTSFKKYTSQTPSEYIIEAQNKENILA